MDKAVVTLGATGVTAAGPATLSGIGNGQFSATGSISAILTDPVQVDFTITLSDGTLKGTLSIPRALITSDANSGTGSAEVTSGTGTYAGAKGSFPTLKGTVSGSLTTVSGLTLSFSGDGQITTSGGGGPTGPPTPTITAVLDAGSYTADIAQGSVFVVKGTNLSAAGFMQFGFPLPTTSTDGVKITLSPAGGGDATPAYLVYLYNQGGVNQLAAILPSTIGAGNYNVIVSNGSGNSTGFPVKVVQRKLAVLTQDGTGSGLAVIQNFISQSQYDVNRFTTGTVAGVTISPAKPGQVLIIWATGMGAVSGGDNVASPGFDFSANGVDVQVLLGGAAVKPLYAGRAGGLAGTDIVNVQLPSNVPTGCTVPLQISVNGVLSAPTFVAIAPDANASACVQPGFTQQQLQNFDNGGTITGGAFVLSQIASTVPQVGTVKIDSIGGAFTKITGFQLAASASTVAAQVTPPAGGSCTVTHITGTATQVATGGLAVTALDAGNITFNGPSGSGISNLALTQDAKTLGYAATLGTEGLGVTLPGVPNVTLIAGKYTLTGAGGKDVGKFDASITLGSPLTITGGLPATVNRSAGLKLDWTGGNATDVVEIVGYAGGVTGSGTTATIDATEVVCITTAGAKTFTVPASVLTQLPAAANSTTQTGFLEVVSTPAPSQGNGLFQAPLTAGGNINSGIFLALIGQGGAVAYQ